MRNKFADALSVTLQALRLLGVELDPNPTSEMADKMFEEVKNEMLAVGFDAVLRIPRATDAKTDVAVSLLGDAGTQVLKYFISVLRVLTDSSQPFTHSGTAYRCILFCCGKRAHVLILFSRTTSGPFANIIGLNVGDHAD